MKKIIDMPQNTLSNISLSPRDRYDVWAESYDKSTASFGWTAPQFLLEAVTHHAPPAGFLRVLDVGVGTGQASVPYLEIGACVTGLDVSSQMLQKAQSKYPQFHTLIEHDFNYPLVEAGLQAQSFDVILSCGALHFAKDLSGTLAELKWVLAPGGLLAFTYIPSQSRRFSTATRLYDPNEIEHLLQQLDLTLLDHKSFVAYYDGGDSQDPVIYRRVIAYNSQPGILLPTILQDIDRTACIDRDRLLNVANQPLMTGTLATDWTYDYRKNRNENQYLVETLRSQLQTGEIQPKHLPLPTTTGELARQGKPGCDVLIIMPHPDDESIYAGGTIAALTEAGQRVRLVVATNGAAGRGGEKSRRVEQRALELRRAAESLKLERVECLELVDFGKYRDASRMQPTTAADALETWGLDTTLALLVRIIRKHRPQILLTLHPEVDPNYSLHGHHLGLGVAALVAFHLAAEPGFIIPATPNLLPWAVKQHYTMVPAHHKDSNIFQVEIDRQRKLKALSAYETQYYSTQRLIKNLKTASSSFETLQLFQARCRETLITATVLQSHHKVHKLAIDRDWASTYKSIRQRLYPREALTKLLQRQAESWGTSEAVFANIKKLSHPHTVAVVTGQQVGVLGGPVYTLYKALGAIQQAQYLTAQGIPAVPIFWMASYDSDLDEVQHVNLLTHQAEPKTLSLNLPNTQSLVGSTSLGEGIHSLLNEMKATLGELPHSQEVFAALQEIYQPGATFAEAFARWLSLLTKEFGLIILEPSTREFTELSRNAIARELFGEERSQIPLTRARQALAEQGLSETIPTDRDVLQVFFVDENGTRRRMLPAKEGFALQNSNIHLTKDAVQNLLEQQPERFTPSSLLRPICQDTVLPTIAYVAGPTEQQYFTQLKEVYTWAQLPMPQIVSRPSFTVLNSTISQQLVNAGGTNLLLSNDDSSNCLGRAGLPEEVRTAFDKLEILQQQCFALRTSAMVGQAVSSEAIALKHSIEEWLLTTEPFLKSWGVKRLLEALRRAKVDFPPLMATVCSDLQRSGNRSNPPSTRNVVSLAQALSRLESTLIREGRKQNASGITAFAYVKPKNKPQERSLSVAELIATHGFAIVPHLLLIADCDRIETRVITTLSDSRS